MSSHFPYQVTITLCFSETAETVHVQFQLHKECNFGESFLLVGNEPIMGEWNPASAIPLNWSDGNIWTVELVRNSKGFDPCFVHILFS